MPLNFWHVVRARLPELPIDELAGRASAVLSGTIATAESWDFDVQQLQTQSVQVVAPELLGSQPAQLEIVSFSGKASLDGQFLRVDGASLTCDFANAAAQAVIPWPLTIPSAADPFLRGATLEANGTVDLPRLVKAAETLIPVREGTQLLAGQVQCQSN